MLHLVVEVRGCPKICGKWEGGLRARSKKTHGYFLKKWGGGASPRTSSAGYVTKSCNHFVKSINFENCPK